MDAVRGADLTQRHNVGLKQHQHQICVVKLTIRHNYFKVQTTEAAIFKMLPALQITVTEQQPHWICVVKPTNTSDHCHWFRSSSLIESVRWSQPTLQITVTDPEAAASLKLCGEANQHCRSLSLSQKQHHWICAVKPINTADRCHWFRSSSLIESVWWSQPTLQITVTDLEAAASLNLCGEANQHCRSQSLIQKQHHWICVVKPTNTADHCHWFRSSITESVWWSQPTLQIIVTDSEAASLNLCGEANQHCRSLSLIQKQHHWICMVKPTNTLQITVTDSEAAASLNLCGEANQHTADHCHWFRSSSVTESVWWSQPTHCRSLSLIQKQQHHWICVVKPTNTADHCRWFRSSITESVRWSQSTLQIIVTDSEAAASLNLYGEVNQHCRSLSLIQTQQHHWICAVKPTNTSDHHYWLSNSITKIELLLTSKIIVNMSLTRFCHDMSTCCSVDRSPLSSCQQVNLCVDLSLTRYCRDMPTLSSSDQSTIIICENYIGSYCWDMQFWLAGPTI